MISAWVANISDGLFDGCLTSQPAHAETIISKHSFSLLIAVIITIFANGRHIAIGVVDYGGFVTIVICGALIPATRDTGVVSRINCQRFTAADIALKSILASRHRSRIPSMIQGSLQLHYMGSHTQKRQRHV